MSARAHEDAGSAARLRSATEGLSRVIGALYTPGDPYDQDISEAVEIIDLALDQVWKLVRRREARPSEAQP
jgi:hypothetical protein